MRQRENERLSLTLTLHDRPEFDNFGAVMSVSEDLLCAFELLKPLDGAALKKEMAKNKRRSLMQHQSPPAARGGASG